MGFVRVANEAMCRPIRALTQAKGYDTSRHALACFGGAGGQHACAIARSLGKLNHLVNASIYRVDANIRRQQFFKCNFVTKNRTDTKYVT